MARKPKRKIFSHLVFLKAFREHRCILLYNETSLCFCFYCLFSYSHCEMGILLKGGGGGRGEGFFTFPQQVICTMTLFYYYDQKPSRFCFLVQIKAFVI